MFTPLLAGGILAAAGRMVQMVVKRCYS